MDLSTVYNIYNCIYTIQYHWYLAINISTFLILEIIISRNIGSKLELQNFLNYNLNGNLLCEGLVKVKSLSHV